jgi:hypothetical protein
VRPEGWTGVAARTPTVRRVALVGGALGLTLAALVGADWLIGGGQMRALTCAPVLPVELCQHLQPSLPVLGWIGLGVFSGLAILAVINLAFDLAVVAGGLVAIMYIALGFWMRFPWSAILDGSLTLASPLLALFLHVAAAGALILAAALIHVFREPAGSEAEKELTEWLRAEAFLPERRPTEREATS